MIKTIFFDFGNILVTYDNVFNKVCRDFKINLNEFVEYYNGFEKSLTVGEIKTDLFWEKCIENFSLDLQKAKRYDFEGAWVSDYEIIKPINNLVYELNGKMNIGVISNINSGIWEAALRDNWVPKVNYKSIILSCEVGIKKPDKEIYEIAEQKSGVNPEEILFIDDKEKNLVEPTKMNWAVVHFDPEKPEEGVNKIKSVING
jgi:putative hydrolase of the HAD superfamily